ncbi:MAG: cupin domain-containing protein [Bdellovibrionota bacterium]|nr:cupin domain-containing protein [Bdellovibrionota bacterium]
MFHQEKQQAGRRSSRSHFHSKKQECVFVISGVLSVFENNEVRQLRAGESYSFPPSGIAHYLQNEGSEEVVYLSVATDFNGDRTEFVD